MRLSSVAWLVLAVFVSMFDGSSWSYAAQVDVIPRRIATIPPGTRVGKTPPRGWTNLIFTSYPRMSKKDAEKLPAIAKRLSTFLTGAMVANVVREEKDGKTTCRLQQVAFGLGTILKGQNTIITSETQEKLGADLGMMERVILTANEEFVRDRVRQVARSNTMAVIDMTHFVLYKGEHRMMTVRYCILVSPDDGKVGTLLWLLERQPDKSYRLAEPKMQYLPARFQEDRLLTVDADKIIMGTIPKEDAFALVRIPQGTAVSFSPELKRVATIAVFTPETAQTLEKQLWKLWGK